MLTTSYPRWAGDPAGCFVMNLAVHLTPDEGVEVTVFAPAAAGVPMRDSHGRVQVQRLRYFWPPHLQRLAYGAGIPWNLRTSWVAWLNIPVLLMVFLWTLVVRGRRFDLIHAHWGVLGALAVLARPLHRRTVVLTVHGSDLCTTNAMIHSMTCFAIKRADAVVTPSAEFYGRCVEIAGDSGRCQFLPNGVSIPPLEELRQQRAGDAPARVCTRVVSVGRLVAERRHDLLIRAFAQVKRHYPSASLTIVGDGPERIKLQVLVRELGLADCVRLVGQVPTADVSGFLLSGDLYVSPTTIETFGIAVVEAAAHALPVVTTRVGFPADLVVDGQTGYVVDPEDDASLTQAILKVFSDSRLQRQMGWRMRQRTESMGLTWSVSAKRYAEVYRQCTRAPEQIVKTAGAKEIKPGPSRAIQGLLFLLIACLVGTTLARQFATVDWATVTIKPVLGVFAAASMVAVRLLSSTALRLVLAAFQSHPGWWVTLIVPWLMQIGKYVPGKIASVTTGMWLLTRHGGVPGTPAAAALIMLTGLGVLAGFMVAAPLCLWDPLHQTFHRGWWWYTILTLSGAVCLHPRVFVALANLLLKRLQTSRLPEQIPTSAIGYPIAVLLVQRVVNGFSLYFVASSITQFPAERLLLIIAISSLAETCGFLAFFAPGGLGVGEGILLATLAPVLSGPIAAVVVVVYRLMHVFVELMMASIALGVLRFTNLVVASRDSQTKPTESKIEACAIG